MARPPKTRDDYRTDAKKLLILAEAIKNDKARPSLWCQEMADSLVLIAGKLLVAPEPFEDLGSNGEKEKA